MLNRPRVYRDADIAKVPLITARVPAVCHGCGEDMSTPQKCLSTRHYLQTTSDNRRSGRLRPSSLTRGYKPRRGNLYVARPYSPDIAAATTELTGQDRERSPADGHRGAPGAAEAASAGAARAAASGTSVAPARTGPAEGPGAAAVPDRAGHYRDRGDGAVRRCLQPGTWPCDAASHHHWPRRQPRSAARPPWSAGAGDPRRARVPPPMPRPRPPGRRSASRPATPRSSSARKARSC